MLWFPADWACKHERWRNEFEPVQIRARVRAPAAPRHRRCSLAPRIVSGLWKSLSRQHLTVLSPRPTLPRRSYQALKAKFCQSAYKYCSVPCLPCFIVHFPWYTSLPLSMGKKHIWRGVMSLLEIVDYFSFRVQLGSFDEIYVLVVAWLNQLGN